MAWASNNLAAIDLINYNRDITLMLAEHVLNDHNLDTGFLLQWRDGVQTWISGTPNDDGDYLPAKISDGFCDLITKPKLAATSHTFLVDMGSEAGAFDSLAIIGHNFDEVGVTSLEVSISDDNSWTTRPEIILTTGAITSPKRLLYFDLGNVGDPGPNIYSSVRYLRVVINLTGSDIPEIGELILGKRSQLYNYPLMPFDPDENYSEVRDFKARNGKIRRYVYYKSALNITAKLMTTNKTEATVLSNWWKATKYGTRSFLWALQPKSLPEKAPIMMLEKPKFEFPYSAPWLRTIKLDMTEVPPFVESET